MQSMTLPQRVALADQIRALRQKVGEDVTEEFLSRHPDWLERYGERTRHFGIEDACFHLDFLAGAVEAASLDSFRDYARWTVGMLQARGIGAKLVVENIRQIESALARHVSPMEQEALAAFFQAGCEAVAPSPSSPEPATEGLALVRNVYLQALLQGSRKPALTVVLEALNQGSAVSDLYVDVLQEAMYEIGRLWEMNRITVAEEHTATAITQYVLAQLYERMPQPTDRRGKVVVTGVAQELHQVGANMVADALEGDGWDVRFLGTNMPHTGILKVVNEHQADVVGISATMLFNVPQVRQLVSDISLQASRPIRIVVGGGAFRSAPNLYAEIGADGFAPDLRSAVALLRSFKEGHGSITSCFG